MNGTTVIPWVSLVFALISLAFAVWAAPSPATTVFSLVWIAASVVGIVAL